MNISIAENLFNHTAAEIKKSGLPAFYYNEQHQRGASFGEKMSNAMGEVFVKGYNAVVVVGSDTPSLNAAHLKVAATTLQNNSIVAGPTQLGGCYLFGMQRDAFQKETIAAYSWQTNLLAGEISARNIDVALLPVLLEVNSESNLYLLLAKIKTEVSQLRAFLNNIFSVIYNRLVFPKTVLLTVLYTSNQCAARAP